MPDDPAPAPDPTELPEDHPLIERYRESYRLAGVTTGFGTVVKAFGWVVGALTLISGVLGSLDKLGPVKFVFAFGGFVMAVLVVLAFYIIGATVEAVGQILRASVDTAVNTSHFLTNEQKALAMN